LTASISAALQYREGYTIQQLTDAAQEFLQLNQTDVFDIQIDTDSTDSSLLPPTGEPRRKLVRVTASRHVRFGFLNVIGIPGTDITATSVGEAASVDIVLVLDASISMSYEGGGDPKRPDSPLDDPSTCNPTNTCQPFRQIKDVAIAFVNQLYFPYDRVAIITFDREAHTIMQLDRNDLNDAGNYVDPKTNVIAHLNDLNVFQPAQVCPDNVADLSPLPNCLNYPLPARTYMGLEYPLLRAGGNVDFSSVPSSNIGDGLWMAGLEFGREPIRQDSLWVVIVLAGGPASTGCTTGNAHNCTGNTYADGRLCPPSTWAAPYCRDASASTRHAAGTLNYDADDYARDAADFLANPTTGQGATVFSIGLGEAIRNASAGDADAGQQLLNYVATLAGNAAGVEANHGLYFYAPSAANLREIFRTIAESIATRLSQ
jgi:hypothetical protein